jgi:hypothetical protein
MSANQPETAEPKPKHEERIEGTFRNGSLTVVGIVVGFSLSFLSLWSTNPAPCSPVDLLAATPLIVGIALQIKSLADFLSRKSIWASHYDRTKNIFLVGLILAGVGIVIALRFDAFGISQRRLLS